MSKSDVEILSQKVLNSLISLDIFKNAKIVALYSPFRNEVDVTAVLNFKEKRFVFPKVEKGSKKLIFFEAFSKDDFEKGAYGILEPKTSLNRVEIAEIDLFLTPGVAFSATGERIGYGGGFYDSTLKFKNKKAKTLGVAFDIQIVESGFSEHFDQRLDAIVTDKRVFIINN